MNKIPVLCVILVLLNLSSLQAQDVRLFVVYAEGKGFEHIRNGKQEYIDLTANKAVGYELKAGDLVNVEPRTTLEIQIFPSQTVVKVSESSSFTVKAVSTAGALDLEMAYGRLRTKTDERQATGNFRYNGVDVAATGVGTDFGFDQIFTGARELVPAFYCFAGALEISKASGTLATAARAVQVAPQEMVTVIRNSAGAVELVKTGLGAEMKSLWQKNDFKTISARTAPEPDTTALALSLPEKEKAPKKDDPPPVKKTVTPEPVMAPEAAKAPVADKMTETDSPLVDNKEDALGARDKLASVGEKDIFVNPDFSQDKEKTAAAPSEPPAEEKKEEPAKETAAAEPEAKPAPQADANAPPAVSVTMDIGVEINYLMSFTPPALTSIPGLEWLVSLLDILMRLKAGLMVDLDLMFFGIIGIGVESGILYNEITTQDAYYQPVLIHMFSIPILGTIRLPLGPLFLQPHFGIVIPGVILNNVFVFGPPLYEMGGKLGLRLGNVIIYATVGLTSDSFDTLFTSSAALRLGAGLLFKIF